MSAMGIQVNPVVTGVFTNQTGYDSFDSVDLTEMIPKVTRQWSNLSPHFDGILTGFLLCDRQYEYILDFIARFKSCDTLLLVDPVMADDGEVYGTYTPGMVEGVKRLCSVADIITLILPNLEFSAAKMILYWQEKTSGKRYPIGCCYRDSGKRTYFKLCFQRRFGKNI